MTEQELFDELHTFCKGKTNLVGAKNISFMVVMIAEAEETTTMGTTLVDPALPSKIPNPPINATMPQHALIRLSESIKQPLNDAIETAQAYAQAVELVGAKAFLRLLKSSATATEFTDRINEEISKND